MVVLASAVQFRKFSVRLVGCLALLYTSLLAGKSATLLFCSLARIALRGATTSTGCSTSRNQLARVLGNHGVICSGRVSAEDMKYGWYEV